MLSRVEVGLCVPFIAQLSRKSFLMERHLQGISLLLLQRVEGGWMCAFENGDGEAGRRDGESVETNKRSGCR